MLYIIKIKALAAIFMTTLTLLEAQHCYFKHFKNVTVGKLWLNSFRLVKMLINLCNIGLYSWTGHFIEVLTSNLIVNWFKVLCEIRCVNTMQNKTIISNKPDIHAAQCTMHNCLARKNKQRATVGITY